MIYNFSRDYIPSYPPNACRIYGNLDVNKVAGNFHVTSGKSVALPRGHFHFTAFHSSTEYNFTHRINRFSFGKPSPGIIHPLEGDEKITTDSKFPSIQTDFKFITQFHYCLSVRYDAISIFY